jgi:hypothetical protein
VNSTIGSNAASILAATRQQEQGTHLFLLYDFRRIALSLEGVEENPHAGLPAFRVSGGNLLRSRRKQRGSEI